ncbi:probable methyltransferase PMT12 [Camellia sinensis]|uniref:probable methyltransferase PMT12 n=1 Tax=Camellia sinensis TaxID=4442 RepID=UPI00103663D3|nr:probable methyltransferase PMT12 [Camellia sinensis]
MNVVLVSGFNTLPVIYDCGLVGVMHDRCEPFDTYPRTYDLLNTVGLFSIEEKRVLWELYLEGWSWYSPFYPLTKKRAKPAVPLGANYHLIWLP